MKQPKYPTLDALLAAVRTTPTAQVLIVGQATGARVYPAIDDWEHAYYPDLEQGDRAPAATAIRK